MSLFKEFGTSAKHEQQGVEFTYTNGAGDPMFRVRLARMGGTNNKYDQALEKVMAPHRRNKKLDPALRQRLLAQAFAKGCALPGTWAFMETVGMQCEGNEAFATGDGDIEWKPQVPKARTHGGWISGIQTASGEIVKDTADAIAEVLSQLPDLLLMLMNEASSREAFSAEDLVEDSKN